MVKRAFLTSSVICPKYSIYLGSHTGIIALSLLEQGRFAVNHMDCTPAVRQIGLEQLARVYGL
jgi:hypothetical protein